MENSFPLMMLEDRGPDWSRKLAIFKISESSLRVKVIIRPSRQPCPLLHLQLQWQFYGQRRKWQISLILDESGNYKKGHTKYSLNLWLFFFSLLNESNWTNICFVCLKAVAIRRLFSCCNLIFNIYSNDCMQKARYCLFWSGKYWTSLVNRQRSFW